MCVSILLLQSLNDAVPLLRGEMTGDADSEHARWSVSFFSGALHQKAWEALWGSCREKQALCNTNSEKRLCSPVGR